jgi:hypothetical protein
LTSSEIYCLHKNNFELVLSLKGAKRPHFAKNPKELVSPQQINGTDIFAETKISTKTIIEIAKKVLNLFGYDEDLKIEIK